MEMMKQLLLLIFCALIAGVAYGAPVTAERYNDFYKRKKNLAKEDQEREAGQKKIAESRRTEELEYERKAAEYVKKRKAINQDKVDETAEKWMEEQNRLSDSEMDKAREKYISNQKSSKKFIIPEVEEFEVE